MIDRFLVLNHGSERPEAKRIIFCDGAGGGIFREETDLELSHWRPNRTPKQYRAGTSTEICFRFLNEPIRADWTVAVNNHLDVDGILSVFALVHSDEALANRQTLIQAAEMGDFWGWGDRPAQRLFQGITRLMNERSNADVRAHDIYAEAFERIPLFIAGNDSDSQAIDESLKPLRRGLELVESGSIQRTQIGPRFAHYVVPVRLTKGAEGAACYVPGFNEAISPKAVLWPQVRAKWEKERVCLVSAECESGWRHDLWCPGYLWADTEGLWTVPGMHYRDGMESYELDNARLRSAVNELQSQENSPGKWSLGDGVSPFHRELQSSFPVVLRFLDDKGQPADSGLSAERVGNVLESAFKDPHS